MAEYVVRPATEDDIERLAAVKSAYIRSLYRGFLPADYLRQATAEFYVPEVTWWLRDGSHVDALEIDGQIVGYVVYGTSTRDPSCGIIREEAILPNYGRREKDTLAQWAIRQLTELGFRTIHLWVLRDNFRVRFLFESIGFRPDGTVRVEPRDNLELCISRYVYHVPVTGSGHMQNASIE